ncbi:sugar ABC transporter permease [Priestia flexa]|uniref:carbohydrate ABC transporter permease n=1 Tax=Priestia TaxID=2800373 RepID=UPI000ADD2C64|nr:sugar ABC transporter permease [Priestia flexa]MED4589714.1 sugar ABC transporter permease [Priestia flexa]
MAGVSGISRDYYEAALVDGANHWQTFTKITLPLLKPILLYIMITSLIGGLQLFDLPMLLTDGVGSPDGALNTMVLYLYITKHLNTTTTATHQQLPTDYLSLPLFSLFLSSKECTVTKIKRKSRCKQ